ncbi:MAG: hypothetical protein WCT39_00875 [Candidatus Margulisiibacteriota bacterium]|jgi:hypothetical protein
MSRIFFAFLLALLVASSCFAGVCVSNKAAPKKATIKQILNSPRYIGTTVIVKGVYSGWGSKSSPPPITKSDYVIKDASGEIYVTGPMPLGMTMKDVGKTISIKAKVRSTNLKIAGKQWKIIYLEVL